jgi:HD-GYP domain-containing protein (c-di-GMP phosphodiesterase class II)
MQTLENRVAEYGKSLIINFSILVRAAGIYDSANDTILNMAKRLLDDIEIFLEETGDFTVKIIEGSFYIEGIRIKAGLSDIEVLTSLAKEFKKKLIGVFDFKAPVTVDDLVQLAYALNRALDASEVQSILEHKLTHGITIGGPVFLQKEEGIDLKDNYAVAKRSYVKALSSLKSLNDSIKAGRRVKLKRIKRAIQLMVDSILTDEIHLIGFTAARHFEKYSYFHPVNVSILSILLGQRIGLDRQYLRALAIAALFHDIGKIEIPPAILDKKGDFTTKERDLIKRHPEDGVRVLLKSFGLSETLILSMLVSLEHHMKFDFSGYPASPGKRKANLFSRIVSIADDYDSLLSGKVYERQRLNKTDALKLMSQGSGTVYDPLLLKAFMGIFR